MKRYPIMAHNAAFEDSWFMLHLPGYAEARRAGKIIVIDSRHICRSETGVPLADIHHIQWSDLDGKTPFREDAKLQKELLKLMKR